jgi:hypothetical protein
MKWDFTPEDVRNGKANYTVGEFKKDLLEEIQLNIAKDCGDQQTMQFYSFLTIMLCTSMAFGKSIDSFVSSTKKYFPSETLQDFLTGNRALLEDIRSHQSHRLSYFTRSYVEKDCNLSDKSKVIKRL